MSRIAPYEIITIASSAGGLTALEFVLSRLPADFPASIAIVQHLDRRHRSLMVEIMSRRTPLKVQEAHEGAHIEPGVVYIASPNRHLLVKRNRTFTLTDTELVHFVRPSADLLFESAAASFGSKAIGLVLTGTGADASMGVQAIRKMGGTVLVQDPETAEFGGMPSAAVATGAVDFVLPLEQIPAALESLVRADDE